MAGANTGLNSVGYIGIWMNNLRPKGSVPATAIKDAQGNYILDYAGNYILQAQ